MASPTCRKNGVLLQPTDLCPICGPTNGHLISDHDESKARQCSKCACVAQTVMTHIGPRA